MVNLRSAYDPLALLQESAVFGILPEAELQRLAGTCRLETYKVATLLSRAREPVQWHRLVLRGHIEISARDASGDEVVLTEFGPGSWPMWVACVTDVLPANDTCSSAGCVCMAMPTAELRATCERWPQLYRRILIEVGMRMRMVMEWTSQSVLLRPEQRLAKLLVILARTHGITGTAGRLPITQARLARLAGCSRSSVSELLGLLRQRKLVDAHYGWMQFDDLGALTAFADDSATRAGAGHSR
ncbi:MAG: Crp/Fnr family transcriptional regulator [Burkholderiales bacterium]|nr:Crp/Fnr family transcriptional regulator [Burkholderiales bacterium]